MTQVQYPNRPTERDLIHANFEAITGVVNGDLRDDNVAEKAAIAGSKIDYSKMPDGSIPASKVAGGFVPPGGAAGDILIWNGSTWVAQAQSNVVAGTLDGIDSTGFLQTLVAGGKCNFGTLAGTTNASGRLAFGHSLGVVPTICLVTPKENPTWRAIWLPSESNTIVAMTYWFVGTTGTVAGSTSVQASVLVAA